MTLRKEREWSWKKKVTRRNGAGPGEEGKLVKLQ
jgi:hypothetical protein